MELKFIQYRKDTEDHYGYFKFNVKIPKYFHSLKSYGDVSKSFIAYMKKMIKHEFFKTIYRNIQIMKTLHFKYHKNKEFNGELKRYLSKYIQIHYNV